MHPAGQPLPGRLCAPGCREAAAPSSAAPTTQPRVTRPPHSLTSPHFPSDHRGRNIPLLPAYRALASPTQAFPARTKFSCLTSAFDLLFPFPSKTASKRTLLRRMNLDELIDGSPPQHTPKLRAVVKSRPLTEPSLMWSHPGKNARAPLTLWLRVLSSGLRFILRKYFPAFFF